MRCSWTSGTREKEYWKILVAKQSWPLVPCSFAEFDEVIRDPSNP